ncbi:MAG: hypothetical protein ACRD1C_05435 [Terriglobales bacterium]
MAVRTQTLMLLLLALTATAQIPTQDPLTPQEADQVRATAGQLDRRVPLLVGFAQERIAHFEQVRASSAPGRPAQMYALLRQYQRILPELNDAMDDLSSPPAPGGPRYKVGKVLGKAVTQEKQMLAELQHIRSTSPAADLATYHFELQNCLDATHDSMQIAEQDLADAGKK